MTVAGAAAARSLTGLRERLEHLRTIETGAPIRRADVASDIAAALHHSCGDALAVVYRPALRAADWLVVARGPGDTAVVGGLATSAMAGRAWFLYDPLRPSVADRNVVQTTERPALPEGSGAFFDRLGPRPGQTRVLVCDGPVLLAWVGFVRPAANNPKGSEVVRSIGRAARKRLRVALAIPEDGEARSFEASLDRYPGEAYVVRRNGFIEHANRVGARGLAGKLGRFLVEVPLGRATGIASSDFDFQPLRGPGSSPLYLATRRTGRRRAVDLEVLLARASTRWRLTLRQVEVLRRLTLGDANKDIASHLQMSVRTVEQHVATILVRARVDSRLRLVATVWSGL